MNNKPTPQHDWLQKYVGEWTYEGGCPVGPGHDAMTFKGTESGRSLGGLWILLEGKGEEPGGKPATMIITLGFDTAKNHFVGTFVGTMMDYLWTYTGELVGDKLTLHTEGPAMSGKGNAKYQEVVEFFGNDERTFTSSMQQPDGTWKEVMSMRATRVK